MSEVRALAHGVCNGDACSKAWPFAGVVFLIPGTKLYILRYCSELAKGLDCMSRIAFLNILETRSYYCCDVFTLRSEQHPHVLKSMPF
jgi:hypothetical protein